MITCTIRPVTDEDFHIFKRRCCDRKACARKASNRRVNSDYDRLFVHLMTFACPISCSHPILNKMDPLRMKLRIFYIKELYVT